MFVGRWQPFHFGHETLIRSKLDAGIPVLVMVRDTPVSESNPYTTEEVISMIEAGLAGEDAIVMAIPDIESVNWGRGVGYETNEIQLPDNIKRISATEIRKRIEDKDESWTEFVNPKVAEWLRKYHG
jgi:nicotinamide mononucleotide adenylyltransferase